MKEYPRFFFCLFPMSLFIVDAASADLKRSFVWARKPAARSARTSPVPAFAIPGLPPAICLIFVLEIIMSCLPLINRTLLFMCFWIWFCNCLDVRFLGFEFFSLEFFSSISSSFLWGVRIAFCVSFNEIAFSASPSMTFSLWFSFLFSDLENEDDFSDIRARGQSS